MKQLSWTTSHFSFLNFARIIISFSIILTVLHLSEASIYGQSQLNLPGIDPTFAPQFKLSGSVERTILQPDGKIIFIGSFNEAGGVEKTNVVRLNADNSIDDSFNLPPDIDARSLQLLPDGRFFANSYTGIFRLNSDGSIDPGFNFARTIQILDAIRLKPRSDGKVFAFGRFKVKKQKLVVAENFILIDRLGGIESGFQPSLTGSIQNVVPLPNGKTMLNGAFEIKRAGQTVGRNFAMLDENGAPDAGFDGFYGKSSESVFGAQAQPDGKFLLYGTFSEVYKQTLVGKSILKNKSLLRLNADGSFDRDFSVPFTGEAISEILIQPDGGIIVSGTNNLPGTPTRRFFSRILSDGSPDYAFNNNLPFLPGQSYYPALFKWEMMADGRILMSGNFTIPGRPGLQKLVRLNADGTLDATFQTPRIVGGYTTVFDVLPDGNLLIHGSFGKIGSRTRIGLARLNPNGLPDENFRFDFTFSTNIRIETVTAQADGKCIISGRFAVVNGEYVHNLESPYFPNEPTFNAVVRLNANGTLDNSFAPFTNAFEEIRRVVVQPDGKILIGGRVNFSFLPNFIVRLNQDGTPDADFNRVIIGYGSAFGLIMDIAAQPDGKILIAGYFTSVAGAQRNKIARLMPDGLLDESFYYDGYYTDFDIIEKIALQPDGKIIAGGAMSGYNRPGLPRFNRSGTLDANFRWNQIPRAAKTSDIQLQPDGKFLFSGEIGGNGFEIIHPHGLYRMNQIGEVEFRYNVTAEKFLRQADGKIIVFNNALQGNDAHYLLTRIFPQSGADNTFNFEFDRRVNGFVEQPDGKILVAGEFTTVNGVRQAGLARLNP